MKVHEIVGIVAQADLATKVGPVMPLEIERVLERISEAGHEVPSDLARA